MKARQELGQFRYVGYLDKGGGKDQAFLSRGGESMTARRGETVQGHFYVKTISPSQVVIVELGTKLEVTLSLAQ
jgi:Tfp pilus assembly protein PilP